jgi:hypothetical protein
VAGPHYHRNSGAPSGSAYYQLKGVQHAAGKLGAARTRPPETGSLLDHADTGEEEGALATEQMYAFFIKNEGVLMDHHLLTLIAVLEKNLNPAALAQHRQNTAVPA